MTVSTVTVYSNSTVLIEIILLSLKKISKKIKNKLQIKHTKNNKTNKNNNV